MWRSQRRMEPGWCSERTLLAQFVHPGRGAGDALILQVN